MWFTFEPLISFLTFTTAMKLNVLTTFLCTSVLAAYALPPYEDTIQARDAAVDNIVYVTNADKFWYAAFRVSAASLG